MDVDVDGTQPARRLEGVDAGEPATAARAGKPAADLEPRLKSQIVYGTAKGLIWYDDSFDDPDPEIIAMFDPE